MKEVAVNCTKKSTINEAEQNTEKKCLLFRPKERSQGWEWIGSRGDCKKQTYPFKRFFFPLKMSFFYKMCYQASIPKDVKRIYAWVLAFVLFWEWRWVYGAIRVTRWLLQENEIDLTYQVFLLRYGTLHHTTCLSWATFLMFEKRSNRL